MKRQCMVRRACPHPVRYRLTISGNHAEEREPTDTCAVHLSVLANDFVSVSNDIRLRGIAS